MGIIGDAQIGKTSLMIKYAEGAYDTEYTQTLGVNFMEKTILIRQAEITFSIWDLGGNKAYICVCYHGKYKLTCVTRSKGVC